MLPRNLAVDESAETRPLRWHLGIQGILSLFFITGGCAQLAVNATGDLLERGAPALEEHWDYELAGEAAPYAIVQMEGLLRIDSHNEKILSQLVRSYTGYAYGWIEDKKEEAEARGEFAVSEKYGRRAQLMYLRGKNLALRLAFEQRSDLRDALREKQPEVLRRWLEEHLRNQEDASLSFWLAYPWGAAINLGRDDPEMLADLPVVRVLMEHAVKLDPSFYHAMGLVFLGFLQCDMPQLLGGKPEIGARMFEKALRITGRKSQLIQVNYAKTCAVALQDKGLYTKLLREVLDTNVQDSSVRMLNKIARVRAQRYLGWAEERFP